MQDPEVAAQFSLALRQARSAAAMSQEALAARAGLDRSAVGQLERAQSSPRLATVIRLAGALDVDPCDLIPPIRWSPPDSPTPQGSFSGR